MISSTILRLFSKIHVKKLCYPPQRCLSISHCLLSSRNILRLRERGVFSDLFPENSAAAVVDVLNSGPQTVYAGFDPTANSLHVGNLIILVNLLHWQRSGHNVVALIGGATGQIGDPSGKSNERVELQKDIVAKNAKDIEELIRQIFKNHEEHLWKKRKEKGSLSAVKVVNNLSWYEGMGALDFIGKVGRNFRVGTMLLKHSVKERLQSQQGISFTEFTYQILQAYDWLYLFKEHSCRFQIGGHDQMGNIVAGYDLIQRVSNTPVFGLTLPLVTSEEGDKFGKSAGNAVWLSENKTSPFQLYQFLMRTKDTEVENLLKLLTFQPLSNILDLIECHRKTPEKRLAQKKLAEEVTLLVHGVRGLRLASDTTAVLYDQDLDKLRGLEGDDLAAVFHGACIVTLMLEQGMTIMDAAIAAGCFKTESDAIRIIGAGGFYVNYQRVGNASEVLTASCHILPNKISLFRVGKKTYTVVKWHT